MKIENDYKQPISAAKPLAQDARLQQIIQVILDLSIHIEGIPEFKVRDFLLDNTLKGRVFKQIALLNSKKIAHISKQTLISCKNGVTCITPHEIYRRRGHFINKTVPRHTANAICKLAKMSFIETNEWAKTVNDLLKFVNKVTYFSKGKCSIDIPALLSDPKAFHNLLKVAYNSLYVLTHSIEAGVANTVIKATFEMADRGSEFDIFTQAALPFIDRLAAPLNPLKLAMKLSGLRIAYIDLSRIDANEMTPADIRTVQFQFGKAVLDTFLIGARVLFIAVGYSAAAQGVVTITAILSLSHAGFAIVTYVQKKNAEMHKNELSSDDPFIKYKAAVSA